MSAHSESTNIITEAAEQSSHRSSHRYTRTRNGCERCRTQRRKCDERKPQCGRCLDMSATCKYVTHVAFKNAHAQVSSQSAGPDSVGHSKPLKKYNTIEFIFEGGPKTTENSSSSSHTINNKPPDSSDSSTNVPKNPLGFGTVEGWPLVGRASLSNTEVELLQYYNHHIAPWLDVYDQGQTFAHCVTRLAMSSPCVLEALLQVSAVSSGRPVEVVTRRGAGIFHLRAMSNPPGAESPSSALRTIACFVLARTLLFVDGIPDTWESSFQGSGAILYFRTFDFVDSTERKMWFAFLTLILRLETAYCLMNRKPPIWIPELAHQIQTGLGANIAGGDESQQVLEASIRCLKLLVDVMVFSFSASHTNGNTATPSISRIDQWERLRDRLDTWQSSRPASLEPLIEVENPEGTFPTIIFTGGAGISTNMLYHTAMVLLLGSKPLPARPDEHDQNSRMDEAQTSPDWHARRVCGIAVNSKPEYTNCWDPVMIAAFSLAARQVAPCSQTHDILACLGRLKTTWRHIDSLIDRLHSELGRGGW